MRVDLPGGHAELRAPEDVPERLRRPVKRAIVALGPHIAAMRVDDGKPVDDSVFTEEVLEAFDRLNDLTIVAIIESWSYPQPVTVDGLLDLPAKVHDALQHAVAPYAKDLMPDFSVDGVADPKAPTAS